LKQGENDNSFFETCYSFSSYNNVLLNALKSATLCKVISWLEEKVAMPKKAKELSALAVSKLKNKGRYAVGGVDGLHMFIVGNSRTWILRVAVGTRTNSKGNIVVRRRDMGLGSYPEVSLAEARDKARELRKQVKEGIDPIEQKKRIRESLQAQQRQAKTFRECAEVYIENKGNEYKSFRFAKPYRNLRFTGARQPCGRNDYQRRCCGRIKTNLADKI
jgi:hypothetical protein